MDRFARAHPRERWSWDRTRQHNEPGRLCGGREKVVEHVVREQTTAMLRQKGIHRTLRNQMPYQTTGVQQLHILITVALHDPVSHHASERSRGSVLHGTPAVSDGCTGSERLKTFEPTRPKLPPFHRWSADYRSNHNQARNRQSGGNGRGQNGSLGWQRRAQFYSPWIARRPEGAAPIKATSSRSTFWLVPPPFHPCVQTPHNQGGSTHPNVNNLHAQHS